MDILFVTNAIAPYHPGSEIGDVNRALAKALRGLGHHVTVLSPLYAGVDPSAHGLGRKLRTLDVEVAGETRECVIFTGRTTGGVDLVFLQHDPTFGSGPAETDDRASRTAAVALCQAAARYAQSADETPNVVHGFGFQAALAGPLCQQAGIDCASVLSLHDIETEGRAESGELAGWNLPESIAKYVEETGSLLGAGIACAGRTVVDSQATFDALGPFEGDQTVPLTIPHAVDASVWNPMTDAHLEARFDPANQDGKERCKAALQYSADLPVRAETPLVAIIGGEALAVAETVAEGLLRNEVQLIVDTAGAEPSDAVDALLQQHGDRFKCLDASNEEALHQLLAGSDVLCMPPAACTSGILHLCAQRYGAAPVVQAGSHAGELVVDCDAQLKTGSGFTYVDTEGLGGTLARALSAYERRDEMTALRTRIMRIDTSWDRAARRFEHLYRQATPKPATEEA